MSSLYLCKLVMRNKDIYIYIYINFINKMILGGFFVNYISQFYPIYSTIYHSIHTFNLITWQFVCSILNEKKNILNFVLQTEK